MVLAIVVAGAILLVLQRPDVRGLWNRPAAIHANGPSHPRPTPLKGPPPAAPDYKLVVHAHDYSQSGMHVALRVRLSLTDSLPRPHGWNDTLFLRWSFAKDVIVDSSLLNAKHNLGRKVSWSTSRPVDLEAPSALVVSGFDLVAALGISTAVTDATLDIPMMVRYPPLSQEPVHSVCLPARFRAAVSSGRTLQCQHTVLHEEGAAVPVMPFYFWIDPLTALTYALGLVVLVSSLW
jgi:hypothetical protein